MQSLSSLLNWNSIQWGSEILPFKIRKHLKFQMIRFSNGGNLTMTIVPTIWKPDNSKSGHFCPDFKWFLTKWLPFAWLSDGWDYGFQMVRILDYRSHSKYGPFETQPLFDHSKSRLVRISDPHWKCNPIVRVLGVELFILVLSVRVFKTLSSSAISNQ